MMASSEVPARAPVLLWYFSGSGRQLLKPLDHGSLDLFRNGSRSLVISVRRYSVTVVTKRRPDSVSVARGYRRSLGFVRRRTRPLRTRRSTMRDAVGAVTPMASASAPAHWGPREARRTRLRYCESDLLTSVGQAAIPTSARLAEITASTTNSICGRVRLPSTSTPQLLHGSLTVRG